jgi:hypothetical protein
MLQQLHRARLTLAQEATREIDSDVADNARKKAVAALCNGSEEQAVNGDADRRRQALVGMS